MMAKDTYRKNIDLPLVSKDDLKKLSKINGSKPKPFIEMMVEKEIKKAKSNKLI